jgi:hypothetical protein
MVSDPDTLTLMNYLVERSVKDGQMSGIFDGMVYRTVDPQLEARNDFTIYLGMNSDGFRPFKKKSASMTLIH